MHCGYLWDNIVSHVAPNGQPSPIPLLPLLPMTKRPPMPRLPSLSLQIYCRHFFRIPIAATIFCCGTTSLLQVSCLLILIITITMLIVYYSLLQTSWPMAASIIMAAFITTKITGTVLLPLLRIIITVSILFYATSSLDHRHALLPLFCMCGRSRSAFSPIHSFFSRLQNLFFPSFLFSRHL